MAVQAAIAERLRELAGNDRGARRAMATEVGFPYENVKRWLRGTPAPPHDFLLRVAEVYGVTLDWLYGRTDTDVPVEVTPEPAWARRLVARMDRLERMDDLMTRDEVVEMVKGVEGRVTETIRRTATAEDLVDRYVDRTVEELRTVAPQLFGEETPEPVSREA